MSDTRQPLRVESFEDRLALSTTGAHLIPPPGLVPEDVIIFRGDGAQDSPRGESDFQALFGGETLNTLPGGSGDDDSLGGGAGNDTVVGGSGNDVI
jgi:Ca2+-binding RTX toxin-like protein